MEGQITQEDPARERAEKHVKEVRDFFYHLMVYVLVCAMLVFIDLRQGGLDWAFWVIFGWGFGVALARCRSVAQPVALIPMSSRIDTMWAGYRRGCDGDAELASSDWTSPRDR